MKSIKDLSDFHGLCSKNINIYFAETVWYMFIFIFFLVLRSFCDIKQKNANCVKLHKQTKLSFGNWCFCWHFYDKKKSFHFFLFKKIYQEKRKPFCWIKITTRKTKKKSAKTTWEVVGPRNLLYILFFVVLEKRTWFEEIKEKNQQKKNNTQKSLHFWRLR